MFGNGNFRPMMGELKLAQSISPPPPPAAAPAPAPIAAPAPAAAAPAPDVSGMSHGTQVLVAGAVAVLALLGAIFLTD
jgi:hypothetical protein